MFRNPPDWPTWPMPRRGKIPASFALYQARLERIIKPPQMGRRLHKLPLSALQLAKEGHRSREFRSLAADLFRDAKPPEAEYHPSRILAALLFRSGYYHRVLAR